ncbi:hypothetical protein DN402_19385 [Streptomyces sp. SW4]|nr:hypothetical protein DN402_19385 [Streptomyces sp. SW4]
MTEPVFIKSKWGTARYVYNPRNPVGLALIFLSLALTAGMLLWMHDEGEWSEDELRSAVHEAAGRLEAGPRTVSEWWGLEMQIDDAIEQTGEGPSYGARVDGEGPSDSYANDFTVTGAGTDAAFCLHVVEVPVDETRSNLTVDVSDGTCAPY